MVAPPGHKAVLYNDTQCGELGDKKEFKVFERISDDDPRCVDLGSEEDGTRVRSVMMRRRNPASTCGKHLLPWVPVNPWEPYPLGEDGGT